MFKRREVTSTQPPDLGDPSTGWNYETYREYILALTRGGEFLLPIEEYPSRMELSEPWQEMLNQIRSTSHESWALFGYQDGQRRLVLPKVAERGLSHSVPYEVMSSGLEKARAKAGISDMVGDAHSHPRPTNNPVWIIPSNLANEGNSAFSLGDMYYLLHGLTKQRPSDPKRFTMFVAEGNENIAAFATRRSLELVRNKLPGSYEDFAREWYAQYGWNFKGLDPQSKGGGELAERARADAPKIWQINKGVAFHYQLALYHGFRNGPLFRNHPARNKI